MFMLLRLFCFLLFALLSVPVLAQTPRPELLIQTGHARPVNALALSPDAKLVATQGADRTVRLWEVATGRELRVWRTNGEAQGVAFSVDGKLVKSGGAMWRVADGKDIWERASFPPLPVVLEPGLRGTIEIGATAGGLEVRAADRTVERLKQAFLSLDGQWLAAETANAQVKVWNTKTGAQIHAAPGRLPVFSADGNTLAYAGGADFTSITRLDLLANKSVTFGGKASSGIAAAFSPDGNWLAVAMDDRRVKLWDLVSGVEAGRFPVSDFRVRALAFSPDGVTLATGGAGRVRLWDTATGQLRREVSFETSDQDLTLSFNADGRILAVGYGATAAVCDGATGQILHTLPATVSLARAPAFTIGGALLAQGKDNGPLKLWDAMTGREIRVLQNLKPDAFAVSPNGWLATGEKDGAQLWDLSKPRLKLSLRLKGGPVERLNLSADGKMLLVQTPRLLHVYDFAKDSLKEFGTASGEMNFAVFNATRSLVATAAPDGPVELWDAAQASKLLNLIGIGANDWLTLTPDNYFDGSPAAWNQVLWRYDEDTFNVAPIEWFFNEFYYPALLSDIAGGKRLRAPADFAARERRQPALKLSAPEFVAEAITPRTVRIRLEITDAAPDKNSPIGCGGRDFRLFRNGALVGVWRGDVLRGQKQKVIETTAKLVAGENQFTVYGFNRDNVKSKTATLNINGGENLRRVGVAHVLAVGVNQYANRAYNLKYAVADAKSFAQEVKAKLEQQKRYERVNVIPLHDADATKDNIVNALRRLAQQAQPEDAVIIYFAGHGTAQQNQFYLIPQDLGYKGRRDSLDEKGLREILAHSISDRELQDLLEPIDAASFLLVIDACNSGQALEAVEARRGPMNAKGLAQLAYEKGMYVLTAAQSFQAALEAAQLGHGFLTYALAIEGLTQNAADFAPRDGQINAREWFAYATARVPAMQTDKLKQARQLGLPFSFADNAPPAPSLRPVGLVAPPPREAQRPRAFSRREIEATPFIVAKGGGQ